MMKKCRPLAADGIVLDKGKILLVKRGKEPFKGMWAFPAGHVEFNETVEEAVMREVKEETGISVVPQLLVGVYSNPKRDPRQIVTIAYICFVKGRKRKPKGRDDAEEAKWFDVKEAMNMKLASDHNMILKDAIALIQSLIRR